MDNNVKFRWSDYWIECWQINATVKAGVCLLLTFAILAVWFFYSTSTATTYGIECDWAQKLKTDSLNYIDTPPSCDYPNCTHEAELKLKTDDFYPHIMSSNGMEILLNLPNKANFQTYTKTITYEDKDKHTSYEKNTYLTLQPDGRIKVDTVTDKYVYYTSNGEKSFEQIHFAGNYCSEHLEIAKSARLGEVEQAFNHTFSRFFSKFGLVFVLIPWILMCLYASCCATYYTLFKKTSTSAT